MGLGGLFFRIVGSAVNISEAKEIVRDAYQEAISVMSSMVANPGQQSVFNSYVQPEFAANLGPIDDGWEDVDIGEYMDFMGEIVNEGNQIMSAAYAEAQQILSELEEDIEAAGEE